MDVEALELTTAAGTLRDYRLDDNLQARGGTVFLTGTQALVRLPLMQRRLDRERGLDTAGFISGYRGSPLGGYDQELWRARAQLEAEQIRFLPAINEELAATAVLGSQQVETDPERGVQGVFGLWYGKGPGVDRAGDALKHGNVYGSSPHGGVLVVAGDDHGCVSSSMPHQSEFAMQAWGMPVVNPANLAEYLEFGLYGWALSRFSGMWVGFKAISETVESGATVDLDSIRTRFDEPVDFSVAASGLHYRWPDLPGLGIETRHAHKLDAVRAFARANAIDRLLCPSPQARAGIVTCGKAHLDVLEVLRRLGIGLDALEQAGIRLYKVGLSFPLEPTRLLAFQCGLEEILVIEEKGAVVEQQLRQLFYNLPDGARPRLLGKQDADGAPLLAAHGELRPSRIAAVLAPWLARHAPALERRGALEGFAVPVPLSNAADGVRRQPYFCSGCPHNSSTKVPEGSRAQAGIGCHFMASWMDRSTTGLIQMGGEGVDWVAHSMFSKTPHVFQNLGDGTYFHSGFLAIRQAIAGRANITYKILYNDAVAMTGGQPVDGSITVDAIAWQVHAEGARAIAVVSDAPAKYAGLHARFPGSTSFHGRDEMDQVQRRLRDTPGVTVLVYDQTCAAELRRRRKKRELPEPARRMAINSAVCEGCGDCGVQSNCLSIVPLETPFGRKRTIDQSSCNKDYACADGFCPSFVSVEGGRLRKAAGAQADPGALRRAAAALPAPPAHAWDAPFNLLVTGVGGTGVVTVGALVSMAAHLEGKAASVLDFMGFAQKGGAVLSFVRLAADAGQLHQARIDAGQADALLACDMVVAASADALQALRHGHTRVVANTHQFPTAAMVRDPDASLPADGLMDRLRHAAGAAQLATCNGQLLAQQLMGDTIAANILLLGFAWQRGLVPVGLAALERAIELNGVAVEANKAALAAGRLAASDAPLLRSWLAPAAAPGEASLGELIEQRAELLVRYQDASLAAHYREFVAIVRERESAVLGRDAALPLTRAVAKGYAKLLAYKDEYEVARLFSDGAFRQQLAQQFEGDYKLAYHMAPPLLGARKRRFGPWLGTVMRVLAKGKSLRGTPLDVFGYSRERRRERQLARDYAARIQRLLPRLNTGNHAALVALAELPEAIRGFGHVKLASIARAEQRAGELLARLEQPSLALVASAPGDSQAAPAPARTIEIRRYH